MPSFLSKVFGRKKQDDKDSGGHGSDPSLLEGKFEAVSPNVSPTAEKFIDGNVNNKPKSKDKKELPFSLLRSRSPSSPDVSTSKPAPHPHLTLNLPGLKDDSSARALGVVFEADPSQLILSDAVIGSRRLTSLETLVLVRACSQAIMSRGLETLGIMHPHWHSSSPEVQRRLISLFIHSLAPKSPITTFSPTLSAPASAFESEINSTRSPHDIAAVLRWGIRHMQLDGSSFGNDNDWYKTFFEAEKSASYPPTAYSDKLAPKIPATHLELLTATLDLFSSLAAHAEANSISGSKLSKLVGLWLLTADRVQPADDWSSFYSRWDRMGRMLEHLFLSHIRNEAANHRMPKRLMELVQHYPYVKGSSPSPDHDLLFPRPRFSTQRYEALFIRVDTELPDEKFASSDLLKLVANALKADVTGTGAPYELWQKVRQAGAEDENSEQAVSPTSSSSIKVTENLSRILADETIRLLSLRATKEAVKEFKLDLGPLGSPKANGNGHFSADNAPGKDMLNGNGNAEKNALSPSEGATTTASSPATSPITNSDWTQFLSSGFLESAVGTPLAATLMDKDVETTIPKETRSRSIGRKSRHTSPRRTGKSAELTPLTIPDDKDKTKNVEVLSNMTKFPSKVTQVSLVPLDEAFIDFWSDALLDPISSDWPRIIICRFKNSILPALDADEGKKLEWMVVEQVYSKAVPAMSGTSDTTHESMVASVEAKQRGRASSPRPSFSSSARQRLSFLSASFSGTRSKGEKEKDKGEKKKGEKERGMKIGEMGEILKEEDEEGKEEKKKEKENGKKRSSWIPKKAVDTPTVVKEEPEAEKEVKEVKKEDENSVPLTSMAAVAAGASIAGGGVAIMAATQAEPETIKEEKPVEKVEENVEEAAAVSAPEETSAVQEQPEAKEDAAPTSTEPQTVTSAEPIVEDSPKESEEPLVDQPEPTRAPAEAVVEKAAPVEISEPAPAPEAPQVFAATSTVFQSEPAIVPAEVVKAEESVTEESTSVPEPEPEPTPAPAEPVVEEAAPTEVLESIPATEVAAPPISIEPAVTPTEVVEDSHKEEVQVEEPLVDQPVVEEAPEEEVIDQQEVQAEEPHVVEEAPEEEAKAEEPLIEEPVVEEQTKEETQPIANEEEEEMAPVAPVVEEEPSPAAPIIEEDTTVPVEENEPSNVHVEPLREPSPAPAEESGVSLPPIPVVHADIPVPEPSLPPVDLVSETPSPAEPTPAPAVEVVESGLPPAPDSVVLSGETPGPQIALSSSEPAAIALAEKEGELEKPPGLGAGNDEASDVADAKEEVSEAKEV